MLPFSTQKLWIASQKCCYYTSGPKTLGTEGHLMCSNSNFMWSKHVNVTFLWSTLELFCCVICVKWYLSKWRFGIKIGMCNCWSKTRKKRSINSVQKRFCDYLWDKEQFIYPRENILGVFLAISPFMCYKMTKMVGKNIIL